MPPSIDEVRNSVSGQNKKIETMNSVGRGNLGMMMKIKVECYSGYKANERPLRFHIGKRVLEVKDLL